MAIPIARMPSEAAFMAGAGATGPDPFSSFAEGAFDAFSFVTDERRKRRKEKEAREQFERQMQLKEKQMEEQTKLREAQMKTQEEFRKLNYNIRLSGEERKKSDSIKKELEKIEKEKQKKLSEYNKKIEEKREREAHGIKNKYYLLKSKGKDNEAEKLIDNNQWAMDIVDFGFKTQRPETTQKLTQLQNATNTYKALKSKMESAGPLAKYQQNQDDVYRLQKARQDIISLGGQDPEKEMGQTKSLGPLTVGPSGSTIDIFGKKIQVNNPYQQSGTGSEIDFLKSRLKQKYKTPEMQARIDMMSYEELLKL